MGKELKKGGTLCNPLAESYQDRKGPSAPSMTAGTLTHTNAKSLSSMLTMVWSAGHDNAEENSTKPSKVNVFCTYMPVVGREHQIPAPRCMSAAHRPTQDPFAEHKPSCLLEQSNEHHGQPQTRRQIQNFAIHSANFGRGRSSGAQPATRRA